MWRWKLFTVNDSRYFPLMHGLEFYLMVWFLFQDTASSFRKLWAVSSEYFAWIMMNVASWGIKLWWISPHLPSKGDGNDWKQSGRDFHPSREKKSHMARVCYGEQQISVPLKKCDIEIHIINTTCKCCHENKEIYRMPSEAESSSDANPFLRILRCMESFDSSEWG